MSFTGTSVLTSFLFSNGSHFSQLARVLPKPTYEVCFAVINEYNISKPICFFFFCLDLFSDYDGWPTFMGMKNDSPVPL